MKAIEWSRKIFHAGTGLLFLYLVLYAPLPRLLVRGVAATFVTFCIGLELLRHLSPRVNAWVWRTFRAIMRDREQYGVTSATWYAASMSLVFLLCPRNITILTMLFLAVGDPVAAIVGIRFGRTRIHSRATVEGTSACALACAGLSAVSAGVLFPTPLSGAVLVVFSLAAGLIGALAEAAFPAWDDNLVMPMLSAPLLWLLCSAFGVSKP